MTNKICISITLASLALLAATPAAAQEAASTALPKPAMAGPLGLNTTPHGFNAGYAGRISVGGAVTGLGLGQSKAAAGDHSGRGDLSNGQIYIENTGSPVQFYVQAGAYSLPTLGTAYTNAHKTTSHTFGYVPEGYLKVAPNDSMSVEAGKLSSILGNEHTFTFENMNIERGLLHTQVNDITRAVQADYASGRYAVSVQVGDGFYSNKYNWVSALGTYTADSTNTFTIGAGGNVGDTTKMEAGSSLAQNNSQIYSAAWSHVDGAWTFKPYIQYTYVPGNNDVGIVHDASTYGAAVLAKYAFNDNYSLGTRFEYIGSRGSVANGAPNLLFGQGSRAWSVTVTPTYQFDMLFARLEGSYVRATKTVAGDAFGNSGNDKTQGRVLVEAGILF